MQHETFRFKKGYDHEGIICNLKQRAKTLLHNSQLPVVNKWQQMSINVAKEISNHNHKATVGASLRG